MACYRRSFVKKINVLDNLNVITFYLMDIYFMDFISGRAARKYAYSRLLIIIIITGTTDLYEPWPSSGFLNNLIFTV
jgi:hypothetical protein